MISNMHFISGNLKDLPDTPVFKPDKQTKPFILYNTEAPNA